MSGCPVKRSPEEDKVAEGRTYWQYWTGFLAKENARNESNDVKSKEYNPLTNDHVFGHDKQPGQSASLSTVRAVSNIPKGDFNPAHQIVSVDQWVYPSEQQYYNAMKRKGYDPQPVDVPVILAIHNMVNEQGWSKVKEWEALRGCEQPKLKKFSGRPKDISPKAFFRSLIGYTLPFDRHDWVIKRNGQEVRYVIDFYEGRRPSNTNSNNSPVSIYLDVRPALDSFSALFDRLYISLRPDAFKSLPQIANTPSPEKTRSVTLPNSSCPSSDGARNTLASQQQNK